MLLPSKQSLCFVLHIFLKTFFLSNPPPLSLSLPATEDIKASVKSITAWWIAALCASELNSDTERTAALHLCVLDDLKECACPRSAWKPSVRLNIPGSVFQILSLLHLLNTLSEYNQFWHQHLS